MKEYYPFPDDFINPLNKDENWHLDYCKAAWSEWDRSGFSVFYRASQQYRQIAEYMEGRQRIDKYKPLMGIDENADDTWLNLSWEIFPAMPKLVRICMSILNKAQSKVVFTPVDSMATDEKNEYFAKIKARLFMREAIQQQDPKNAPQIIKQLGLDKLTDEPGDQEELEMQAKYTYKHQSAAEMEQDVRGVFTMNQMSKLRKKIRKNLLYYGVAATKDYVDTNGALKIRVVNPDSLIISPCRENDFSDMKYVGEVLELTVEQYAQMDQDATKEQIMKMVNNSGQVFSRSGYLSSWQEAKKETIKVLDLEWASIDVHNYEVNETKAGNLAVVRSKKNRPDFIRKRSKVWYKAKWVIGTDRIFDYGRCTDMKRVKKQLSDVIPNYHIYAPSFYDMQVNSIGKQVMPLLDQLQLDWLKLQQFKSEAKVNGVSIEMGALEDIKFGKGGEVMTPREIYDLFEKKSVLLWRRLDRTGKNQNLRPVEPLSFGGAEQALIWYQSIQTNIQLIKDTIGLNDFTDASTPDPRSLTTTAELAYQATNNSLFDIIEAEQEIIKMLAQSIVIRLQDMAEFGLLDRYALSIGDNSINWIRRNPKISNYDFAIDIRMLPTEQERQRVIEDAKQLFGGDLVSYEDVVLVKNTDDLKEAERILAWRIERRRQRKMQESLMLQQQNAEVQMQSNQASEQAKQQTLEIEYTLKRQNIQLEKELEHEGKKIEGEYLLEGKRIQYEAQKKEKEEREEETED